MKIGDGVTVPGGHEGVIYEFERYNQKGTVCAYINFGGDCMYMDYDPRDLKPMDWTELSNYMKQRSIKFRQREYLK